MTIEELIAECTTYDYKVMLEEAKPELVSIATESGPHAEIALYCIEHGVHCIIEKPMAMSIEDADRIIALSEDEARAKVLDNATKELESFKRKYEALLDVAELLKDFAQKIAS